MQCDHAVKNIWISANQQMDCPKTRAKQPPRKPRRFKEETGALRRCASLALMCYNKHNRKEVSGGFFFCAVAWKAATQGHTRYVYMAQCF